MHRVVVIYCLGWTRCDSCDVDILYNRRIVEEKHTKIGSEVEKVELFASDFLCGLWGIERFIFCKINIPVENPIIT